MTSGKKPQILHITTHLGGGVGSVVLNYIKNDDNFEHKIVCLDYANENSIEVAKNINVELHGDMSKNIPKVIELIKNSDIVLIHFWNHPLLYDFLIRHKFPPSRVIFWSHISGICAPHNFTYKTLTFPDLFVFNTPLGFNNKEVQSLSTDEKKRLRVIWATGGIEHLKDIKPCIKEYFNIGYIGTVDYCRLRNDFLEICSKIKIDNAKFTVCGGTKEKEIYNQAKKLGLDKKFNFTGKIKDVKKYLETFDIFAYPLVYNHSGTCDLVLQEAMAAGVVPVVFNNPMERYIVKNGITGIVVKTNNEYIAAIEKLYKDVNLRNKLSMQAKAYALKHFSINTLITDWKKLINEVLEIPKTEKQWLMKKPNNEIMPKDILFEALGNHASPFKLCFDKSTRNEGLKQIKKLAKMQIWQGNRKGTVHQYQAFFPNDPEITTLSKIMIKFGLEGDKNIE
ncbi:MAG: hypothetical protein A2Y25_01685 [Candidatus Melainabacteria bacterium GWF2_37_15]|nr:MAG: hypothetical protein A2Y25_01685 [Candidatus Melainabacteria bacterium GWF2_37_15]